MSSVKRTALIVAFGLKHAASVSLVKKCCRQAYASWSFVALQPPALAALRRAG